MLFLALIILCRAVILLVAYKPPLTHSAVFSALANPAHASPASRLLRTSQATARLPFYLARRGSYATMTISLDIALVLSAVISLSLLRARPGRQLMDYHGSAVTSQKPVHYDFGYGY
jgi:hypothetical protein